MTEEDRAKDPYDQLIENVDRILQLLLRTEDGAKKLLAVRGPQIRKVRKALAILTDKPSGPINSNLICNDCGHHKASKIHKTHRLGATK